MANMLRLLRVKLYQAEEALNLLIRQVIFQGPPPPALSLVGHTHTHAPEPRRNPEEDIIGDGFLWAVPKNRRSRERRLTRKFGSESGHKKMLPRQKLLTCNHCGHVYQPGRLCPVCYGRTKEVTEAMQAAMNKTQGLHPIEHDVWPVFKGETVQAEDGFFQGKRIVEVERERPRWFSKRLTLKSNVSTSSSTTIAKPTNLA